MKHLTHILFLLLSIQFSLFAQKNKKNLTATKKINSEKVDFIEVEKYSRYQSDTIPPNRKRLSQEQINAFVSNWNKAKFKGVYKRISTYYITIYFKDGSKRAFDANTTNLIKEDSDWTYEIGDISFIENLWQHANTHPIPTIKNIFDTYIQHNESTDSKSNQDLMTASLLNLKVLTDPTDYNLLLNVWMYYDPTDFPSLHLIPELLKKNKAKSIEAIKNRIQNKKEWENENTAPYADLYTLLKELEK